MKRLSLALLTTALVFAAGAVQAKDPDPKSKQATMVNPISPGELTATPEMWFYQQYQQEYKDPKAMVRHLAEVRAVERSHRISSLQWYGFSNQRPRVSSDPYNTDYAPTWVSGNELCPNRWSGPQNKVVTLPRDTLAR